METENNHLFLSLYHPIHDQLFRFCRALTGNFQDAEDLLQDTVIASLKGTHRLKDQSAFKSYIFSIACNLYKMRLRRGKFRGDISYEDFIQIEDHASSPEIMLDFKIIHEKMLSLPRKTAETLVLFHIVDLSIPEIRKIQGGSESGVKLRLHRGRKKLLRLLNSPQEKEIAVYLFSLIV